MFAPCRHQAYTRRDGADSTRGSRLPTDAGAILIVGDTLDLLAWWLRQPKPLPIARIVDIHESVVVAPVIAASSASRRRRPRK